MTRLLLIRRSDNNRWGLPGGLAEPADTFHASLPPERQPTVDATLNQWRAYQATGRFHLGDLNETGRRGLGLT
jgi:8-oxo-dGTP pyrophosphatase MutT (NUDIX family)